MKDMVDLKYQKETALVKLSRSTTNALDLAFVTELSETLKRVREDSGVHSIVVTSSSEKFFCIGYNIPELYNLSKKDFAEFYHRFNQLCLSLYTMPKPTVAAVTGHAIAGGFALTLCCDYRYIAEGRNLMGINVMRLGIPVPYLVGNILQHVAGTRVARDMTDSGEFYPPEKLLTMGVVDGVFPQKEVTSKSVEKAQLLGALPQKAFTATKQNRVEKIVTQASEHLMEKEQFFVDCWFSDETRRLLEATMEKF